MIEPKKCVQKAHAYVPGEQPTAAGVIKLNTNENPYPPDAGVLDALHAISAGKLSVYPDATCRPLRTKLADLFGLSMDNFLVGNGSDEILRIIFETYINEGEAISVLFPTYTLYEALAAIFGVETRKFPLDDDLKIRPDFFDSDTKAVFIPSPNPPYGLSISKEVILKILEKKKRLLVLDEAYIDFTDSSIISAVEEHSNLIVTRTFSKSFSLAGIRLGFACASKKIINSLFKVKDSYNVNIFSQTAGMAALAGIESMKKNVQQIKTTRTHLQTELKKMGINSPPSEGNFVYAFIKDAEHIYAELKKKNIFVRYFGDTKLKPGLRITIGTEKGIDILLAEMRKLLP